MRNKGPGQAEYARIAGERSIGELGQLPIVAGRQRGADFANLPLDEVIIIDQPIGCGCMRASLIDCSDDHTISVEQYGTIIGEATGQGMALAPRRDDRLRNRETSRMLFETLDAEQLGADGITAEPR